MNVVDVFCGRKCMSQNFKSNNHKVLSIDWDKQHNPDICKNILDISVDEIRSFFNYEQIDYMHMSPDCTTYSLAAISHHRNKDRSPKTEKAKEADKVRIHILKLLDDLKPTFFTIENPRATLRTYPEMQDLAKKYFFTTITYCQYGDTRMKPTDIWHNIPTLQLKPPCKNGDLCHVRAPRGSKTGTQGLKGSVERSMIPEQLCNDIYDAIIKSVEK